MSDIEERLNSLASRLSALTDAYTENPAAITPETTEYVEKLGLVIEELAKYYPPEDATDD